MTRKTFLSAIAIICSLLSIAIPAIARTNAPEKVTTRGVYTSIPNGYFQLENSNLYFGCRKDSYDIIGRYWINYYSSTYNNEGFTSAMKVNEAVPISIDPRYETISNGVACNFGIELQGNFAKISYNLYNYNDSIVKVSVGTYARLVVGYNTHNFVSRNIDTNGETYGFTINKNNNINLSILFGDQVESINGADDYWFGFFDQNNINHNIVGNYTQGFNWMDEENPYDAGFGICWKDREIPAESSVTFSYLICVGDARVEPFWSQGGLPLTVENPEDWNDLSKPHLFSLKYKYISPFLQKGTLQYAVDNTEDWISLTEPLESGTDFEATLSALFRPDVAEHRIYFRTHDTLGNSQSGPPNSWYDVDSLKLSRVPVMNYNWGEPLYPTSLEFKYGSSESVVPENYYSIGNYRNNITPGTANFDIEGVYPYTIGKKTEEYGIIPKQLTGELIIKEEDVVFDGNLVLPEWSFTNEEFNDHEFIEGRDYEIHWGQRNYPGTGYLNVVAKGNFYGSIYAQFSINRKPLPDEEFYQVYLPGKECIYDGYSHYASIDTYLSGLGRYTVWYAPSATDGLTQNPPVECGEYDVYLEIEKGDLYYAMPMTKVGSFTIYPFDQDDWLALQTFQNALIERGSWERWDFTNPSQVAHSSLRFEEGKIVAVYLGGASTFGSFPTEVFNLKNLKSLSLTHNSYPNAVEDIVSYCTEHPGAGDKFTSLDISLNEISGNLGELAACFPNLNYLNVRCNSFYDISPLIPLTLENLEIGAQSYEDTLDFNLSTTTLEDLIAQIPTILFYDHQAQDFSKPLKIYCNSGNFAFVINEEDGKIKVSPYDDSSKVFYEPNGFIFTSYTGFNYNYYDYYNCDGSLSLKLTFSPGDANFDGGVNILDIQSMILYMFSEYDDLFNFTAANTYKDESKDNINVQDIICTADILLSKTHSDSEMQRRRAHPNAQTETDAYLFVDGNKLYLYSETPVAALDITIDGEADWKIDRFGFSKAVKGGHLIGYSLSGMSIPAGLTEIAEVRNCNGVIDCSLSDEKAKAISVSVNNVKSGIEGMELNDSADGIIFNTTGQRIKSLNKGVNIIITDKGAKKVVL